MMSITALAATQPSTTPARANDTPEKVRDAASQFEGLLIAQMLRSARESSSGSFGSEDHSSDSIIEIAEQQISALLAASGGIGLSKLVMQGLSSPPAPSASSPAGPVLSSVPGR